MWHYIQFWMAQYLVQLLIPFIFLCIVGIVIGIFISYSYVGGWIKNHNKNNKSK